MIRHLTLALTAALFCNVAHAQQGNLPAPVQKLPPYPPVVCVAPNWATEPCEDRNASGWQCGNVKVTVSSKGTWFEADWSTEYLVTGIEKSNHRFTLRPKDELYLNGKLCTPFGEFGKTKPQAPPATTQLPEPVKCLKPDGTEEPCEGRRTPNFTTVPPTAAEMRSLRLMPPKEYDRPPTKTVEVVRLRTQEEVRAACAPLPFAYAFACSRHYPTKCTIIMLDDSAITATGMLPDVVWRHEIGHCNGWPPDHPNARTIDEEARAKAKQAAPRHPGSYLAEGIIRAFERTKP
jgi:hypothetical protein